MSMRKKAAAALMAAILTSSAATTSVAATTTVGDAAKDGAVATLTGCVISGTLATIFTALTGGVGAVTWTLVGTACAVGGTVGAADNVERMMDSGVTY